MHPSDESERLVVKQRADESRLTQADSTTGCLHLPQAKRATSHSLQATAPERGVVSSRTEMIRQRVSPLVTRRSFLSPFTSV